MLLRQARGPLAHLSQFLPMVRPQPLSAGVPRLAGSLHMQGSSFKKTQWLPPSRPPGRQEVSGICCPLSTHCSPQSPPKVAPATHLVPGERKTTASVHRHLQTPGEACHTPSGVLPQDFILNKQQHLAGDCESIKCQSPFTVIPTFLLFSWENNTQSEIFPFLKEKHCLLLGVLCMELISSLPDRGWVIGWRV